MSYQLVADVLDHAPAQLSPAERLVLVALAELMPARKPWSVSTRVLQRRTGLDRGLRDVWLRLAEHDCDPRVPIGKDKRGQPFYTVPGQSPTYLLPRFVPPDGCDCESCDKRQLTEGAALTAPSEPQVSEGAALTASGDVRTAPDAVRAAPGDVRAAPKPVRTRPAGAGARRSAGARRGRAPKSQEPPPLHEEISETTPPPRPAVDPGERSAEELFAELRRRLPTGRPFSRWNGGDPNPSTVDDVSHETVAPQAEQP